MENIKTSYPSKRQMKHGTTPLAPSPMPSKTSQIESALRHKYLFGEVPPRTKERSAA